jgi:hypothetical protein
MQDDNGWKELSRCLGNVIGPNIVAVATVGTAMGWAISAAVSNPRLLLRALGPK